MPKLSEPQKEVLRTMTEFDCSLYISIPDGYCWYGGRALYGCPGRKARYTTLSALIKRQLLVEKTREKDQPYWRRDFLLTDKGREVARELEEQNAETE